VCANAGVDPINTPPQAARCFVTAQDLDSGSAARRPCAADAAWRNDPHIASSRICAVADGAVGHRVTPVIESAVACQALRP
jgi:hypothetical protein